MDQVLLSDPRVNISPKYNVHWKQEDLLRFLERKNRGELQIPHFQRSFVWKENKVREWAKSIYDGSICFGSFAIYTLRNQGRASAIRWLCDGRQRIEAAERICAEPQKYGLLCTREDFINVLRNTPILFQECEFDDHREAMQQFKRLNIGTTAFPYDYYKGEITEINNELPDLIINAVQRVESRLKVVRKFKDPCSDSIWKRGAVVLFYQYLSGCTMTHLFRYTDRYLSLESANTPHIAVEEKLAKELKARDLTNEEVGSAVSRFEQYMYGIAAEVESAFELAGYQNNGLGQSFIRPVFHLGLWRKNEQTAFGVEDFKKLVCFAIKNSNGGKIQIQKDNEPDDIIQLKSADIGTWKNVAAYAEVRWDRSRKRRPPLAAGESYSHIDPFVSHGEGQVVIESVLSNKARGARSMKGDRK